MIFNYLYRSIPGQTGHDKAAFVAQGASQTLPWIAVSYFVNPYIPEKFQICSRLLPSVATYFKLPYPTAQIGLGFIIVNQWNQFKLYSNDLVKSSTWSDRLLFLLLTYSTIRFAYDSFQLMIPRVTNKEAVNQNETWASRFTIGLVGVSLAVQLKYAPIATLAGIAGGVVIRQYRHMLTSDNLFENNEDMSKERKRDINEQLRTFVKGDAVFNNPQ